MYLQDYLLQCCRLHEVSICVFTHYCGLSTQCVYKNYLLNKWEAGQTGWAAANFINKKSASLSFGNRSGSLDLVFWPPPKLVHIKKKKKSLLCFRAELFENIQESGIYILTLKISPRSNLLQGNFLDSKKHLEVGRWLIWYNWRAANICSLLTSASH